MSKKTTDVPLSGERQALIRAVFDATKSAAWASDWREKRNDPVYAKQPPEPLREAYFRFLEKLWPEWKSAAADYSNSSLLDMYADAAERCDALAMLEYRRQARDGHQAGSAAMRPHGDSTSEVFSRILADLPDPTPEQRSAEREQDRER